MTKFVLYLDQSYVSNLTKARVRSPETHESFSRLAAAITDAVSANKLVCPISPVHFEESELAYRNLQQNLYDTLEAFSCGVEILPYMQILQAQVRIAYCKFLGSQTPDSSWQDIFTRDPNDECDSGYKIGRSRGNFSNWTREVRRYHEKVGVTHRPVPFDRQKMIEAASLIRALYIKPWEDWQAGATDPITMALIDLVKSLFNLHRELTGQRLIDATGPELLPFFDQLAREPTPYIDVYSSMVAQLVTQDPQRRAKGGDLQDVSAAALALPHCHAYTTDHSMKTLIQAIRLHDKYATAVYAPITTDVDRLTEKIERL